MVNLNSTSKWESLNDPNLKSSGSIRPPKKNEKAVFDLNPTLNWPLRYACLSNISL